VAEGYPAIGGTVIFAVAENPVMAVESVAGALVAAGEPQLRHDRVGLDVDPQRRGKMLVAELRGPKREERIARAVEIVHLSIGQAPATAVPPAEPECPVRGQADSRHAGGNVLDSIGAIVGEGSLHRIVGP